MAKGLLGSTLVLSDIASAKTTSATPRPPTSACLHELSGLVVTASMHPRASVRPGRWSNVLTVCGDLSARAAKRCNDQLTKAARAACQRALPGPGLDNRGIQRGSTSSRTSTSETRACSNATTAFKRASEGSPAEVASVQAVIPAAADYPVATPKIVVRLRKSGERLRSIICAAVEACPLRALRRVAEHDDERILSRPPRR